MLWTLLLLLTTTVPWSVAFRPAVLPSALRRQLSTATRLSSRDEEIARLEEQLRQLKQQDELPLSEVDISKATSEAITLPEEKKSKVLPDKDEFRNIKAKDMLLSEGELIEAKLLSLDDNKTSNGSPLSAVLAAIGAAVFLFLFSQIPLGQEDFSRYSVNSGPRAVTTSIDLGDLNPDRQSMSP